MKNKIMLIFLFVFLFSSSITYALDEILTVPAEKSEGIILTLSAGTYAAEIAGGAISLFLPIHPQYQWLYGLAIGTDTAGGQDEPNIGTLYFESVDSVFTQTEAEEHALEAVAQNQTGTSLQFTLKQKKEVRFWVSDFDYSDNFGLERVRVYSIK